MRRYKFVLSSATVLLALFVLPACQDNPPEPIGSAIALSEWITQLENYGTQELLPPGQPDYNWSDAVLLKALITRHDLSGDEQYDPYLQQWVDSSLINTNGENPNNMAPAVGTAYWYQRTGEARYRERLEAVWNDYQRVRRSAAGAVSHTYHDVQLWDDTLYMIGLFLQQAFRATGEEIYLTDYLTQLRLHADKLYDPATGLWYHGWDEDGQNNSVVGSVPDWPDATTGQSPEFWGRGNGWILMSLADVLALIDEQHPDYAEVVTIYRSMAAALLPLQDTRTGHWFQLPIYPQDPDNFIESSCTAMFCYALARGIRLGILDRAQYLPAVEQGVAGLQTHSTHAVGEAWMSPLNVCVGTSVGDRAYYYGRATTGGLSFAVGAFLLAGYELQELTHR